MKKQVELFLDSGAFSAMSQGVVIDINEYIAFIKEHISFLSVYANLDVIGDPEATLQNQKLMEKRGLSPLPCFHFGEDIKYLQYYLKKYDYLALGGMASSDKGFKLNSQTKSNWLDMIFSKYICSSDGLPKVKAHGYGLTGLSLMKRYPWYSVDSTSWVLAARLRQVFFNIGNGEMDSIDVSFRSPSIKEKGMHIQNISPIKREAILRYLSERGFVLGKSSFRPENDAYELKEGERWFGKKGSPGRLVELVEEKGVGNEYKLRAVANARFFVELEKTFPKWPWPFKVGGASRGFSL